MHLNLCLQEGYDSFLKFKEILLHFIFSFTVQKSKITDFKYDQNSDGENTIWWAKVHLNLMHGLDVENSEPTLPVTSEK